MKTSAESAQSCGEFHNDMEFFKKKHRNVAEVFSTFKDKDLKCS